MTVLCGVYFAIWRIFVWVIVLFLLLVFQESFSAYIFVYTCFYFLFIQNYEVGRTYIIPII